MKRARKPPVPELTWAARSDPAELGRESFQRVCSPLSPFLRLLLTHMGWGNDAGRAGRGAEGKAPAGSDATGLGSG